MQAIFVGLQTAASWMAIQASLLAREWNGWRINQMQNPLLPIYLEDNKGFQSFLNDSLNTCANVSSATGKHLESSCVSVGAFMKHIERGQVKHVRDSLSISSTFTPCPYQNITRFTRKKFTDSIKEPVYEPPKEALERECWP